MLSQSAASLPLTAAVAPRQGVVVLVHCADTGKPAVKEGAALLAALGVAGCSLSYAPPQSDHRHVLDCQGLDRCKGGGHLGIPVGIKFIVHSYCVATQQVIFYWHK